MLFLTFICLLLLALYWLLSTQMLEPMYNRRIEDQLAAQADEPDEKPGPTPPVPLGDAVMPMGTVLGGSPSYPPLEQPRTPLPPPAPPAEKQGDPLQDWAEERPTLPGHQLGPIVDQQGPLPDLGATPPGGEGDLVVGGAQLAAEFHRLDLVDEFRIYVHPVLVGDGTPAFGRNEAMRPLRLIETRTFGNGVVLVRHERDRGEPESGALG